MLVSLLVVVLRICLQLGSEEGSRWLRGVDDDNAAVFGVEHCYAAGLVGESPELNAPRFLHAARYRQVQACKLIGARRS